MIDVTLDVKGNGDLLKIDWRSPAAGVASYQIDTNRLVNRSLEVRESLQALITAAMTNRLANKPLNVGLELKNLARAGKRLRDAIFFDEPGDNEEQGVEAEEWLTTLKEAVIHVTIDRQIYIPWGLVYHGDPETLADDAEDLSIEKFRDFWCVRYRLSTLYNRIRDRVVRNPRTTGEARIVKLTNQAAWMRAILQVSPAEQELAAALFPADDIVSSSEFERTWRTEKKCMETDLLYFFGHANGTALAFEKGDLLTMDEFPEMLRRRPPSDRPACMVFLNGCHTAIGDRREGGFLQATAYGGFCGFVGTEAEVPDVFALRFANAFLSRLLYTGATALDVMTEVRRHYWPLSLAYNLSCHPDFRFLAQTAPPSDLLPPPDFSIDAMGSNKV